MSGQTPTESTPDLHSFRVVVAPNGEATLVVREIRGIETRVSIGEFSDTHITELLAVGASSAALEKALAPLLAKRAEVGALGAPARGA